MLIDSLSVFVKVALSYGLSDKGTFYKGDIHQLILIIPTQNMGISF